MKLKKIVYTFLFLLLLVTCKTVLIAIIDFPNDMSLEGSYIVSTYPKGIMYLSLDGANKSYEISWVSKETAPTKVNLNQLPLGYDIEVTDNNWHRKKIPISQFVLKPMSYYSLSRSQGDTESFHLEFWTDSSCVIYKSQQVHHTHTVDSLAN